MFHHTTGTSRSQGTPEETPSRNTLKSIIENTFEGIVKNVCKNYP